MSISKTGAALEGSKKPLFQKLGLKTTHRAVLIRIPKSVKLEKMPAHAKAASKLPSQFDFALIFFESSEELKRDLPKLKQALAKAGAVWTAYRKAGVTDLSRDSVRELAEGFGLETVSLVSIDDHWSAMRLMHPKSER